MPRYSVKVSQSTIDIQRRFFEAVDELSRKGVLGDSRGALSAFCKKYGFMWSKYSNTRNFSRNPDVNSPDKYIHIDAIYYLVKDYNVNAEWLFLGAGRMFKK